MLKQRIITAAILAPLAIAAIFLLPLPLFHLGMTILCLIAAWEWSGFVTPDSPRKRKLQLGAFGLVFAGVALLIPSTILPQLLSYPLTPYALAVATIWWFGALFMVLKFPSAAVIWKNRPVIAFVFGCLTLVPFLWAMLALRSWNYEQGEYQGAILLLYVMLLVWGADTGAYFSGRAWGKQKLAAKVSPGKTLEGLAGGVAVSMLIGVGFAIAFELEWTSGIILLLASLLAVLFSALGDLTESMFKRVAGVKDSGTILPGHGGVMDRIDSLTAAIPVFALVYIVYPFL